ncbi:MAG: condensation domain-containing protein, partial [Syntrophothermus sp.]
RIDNQIKIRGFRIEPGEIEAELLKIGSIKNAKVLTIKSSQYDQQLTAYFIAENGCVFDEDELRDILRDRIPQFMIPSQFIGLKEFPLTPNGKIDCKALAAIKPEESNNPTDSGLTQSEELLCILISKLLNRRMVRASDNFFEIGGHSLKSVQLASMIRDAFGVVISVKDIFNSSTISEISERIDLLRKKAAGSVIEKINSSVIFPDGYPLLNDLSYSQLRLWFLYKMAPESSYYNMSAVFDIKGDSLNIPVLSECINEIVKRHDILRTVFVEQNGIPRQKIISSGQVNIQVTDISDMNPDTHEAVLRKLLANETSAAFDLGQWPLFRFSVIRLSSNENILSLCMHHIITDGWSMGILSNELSFLYNSLLAGNNSELPPLDLQYSDYSAWQRKCINENRIGHHLEYWTKQLSDINPLLELPLDRPRSMQQSYVGAEEKFTITKEIRNEIELFNRKYGITSFMTLLAVYQTLLYRYTLNRDIVTGIPVANRNNKEIENIIGFFVNTLAIRLHFDDGAIFPDILKQVRLKTLEAFEHQDVPFDMIIEQLHPDRYSGLSPVFNTAFVYQNLELQVPQLHGLSVTLRETDLRDAKYDITLEVIEKDGTFDLRWNYSTDLFEASTINRMHYNFMNLLSEMLRNPAQKVSEVRILDKNQYTNIIDNWNNTLLPFPSETCLHHLFEDTASNFGSRTALVFTDNEGRTSEMSYSELNKLSNKIAHYLRRNGLKAESVIAVAVERSFSMIACLLGVMKAGGAFLPLDPEYPEERTAFMLEDSNAAMILTQAAFVPKYHNFQGRLICVDTDGPDISAEPDNNPAGLTFPENLAYIIYTSGSTGKPKGAMIRHQGICNLASAQKYLLGITENDRIFQFSNISFDAAV